MLCVSRPGEECRPSVQSLILADGVAGEEGVRATAGHVSESVPSDRYLVHVSAIYTAAAATTAATSTLTASTFTAVTYTVGTLIATNLTSITFTAATSNVATLSAASFTAATFSTATFAAATFTGATFTSATFTAATYNDATYNIIILKTNHNMYECLQCFHTDRSTKNRKLCFYKGCIIKAHELQYTGRAGRPTVENWFNEH